jgi:succinate dehydrogenase / fumarate reductase membrane anchor subunit
VTTDTPAAAALQIEAPRSRRVRPGGRTGGRGSFEMYAWIFMRISGIALILLVVGHLLVVQILDGGVQRVNFGFVAARYASPFWRTWDLLMLWLAELHGTNGLRTIINDYADKPRTRFWLKMLLYSSAVLVLALGSLVIFTFDPTLSS